MITGASEGRPVGMTANAVSSLSLEPLLMLVCFDNSARTLPVVRRVGRFAVNVLAADGEPLARLFASKRPEAEKFDGVEHEWREGVPVLGQALAWVVCDARDWLPGGDHTIAVGSVVAMDAREGEPLLWYRGAYRALG